MMQDETILRLIDQGLTAYGLGNLKEALAAWQSVLEIDPDNARARDYIVFIEKQYVSAPAHTPADKSPAVLSAPQKSRDTVDSPSTLPPKPAIPFVATPLSPEGASALDLVAVDIQPQPIQAIQDQPPSQALLKSAQDRMELNDFSGALELLDSFLTQEPNHQKARLMHEEAQQQLTKMLFSKLGDLNRVPRVSMRGDEIIWLNLDHRAGFVLSLVDGTLSFDDILSICGLSQLEGTRILAQLLQNNVITAD